MKNKIAELIDRCDILKSSNEPKATQNLFLKRSFSISIVAFLLLQYVPVSAQFKAKDLLKKAEKISLLRSIYLNSQNR